MRILFISHEATRTGAPIMLLWLIEHIKKYKDAEVSILLKDGGELEKDFADLGKTFVWNQHFPQRRTNRLKRKILQLAGLTHDKRELQNKATILNAVKSVDIVFNNTLANVSLLRVLPLENKKVFSYLHELKVIAQNLVSKEDMDFLAAISQKIFVPAIAVKDFYVKEYGFNPSKIQRLPYIIPLGDAAAGDCDLAGDLHNKPFRVGFCATSDWRKGFEFLPLLMRAIILEKGVRDIHFVWLGVNFHSFSYRIVNADLQKLCLESYVSLLEPKEGIDDFLQQLDLFVLPSREDAFPLVVLDAAKFELPCVYFEDAGGIGEFVGNDAGIGVPYLNIGAMAEAIVQLKSDATRRRSMGRKAKERLAEHNNAEKIVKGLLDTLKA
jgi:glycosyltransferase involved in cell wall biosynthesis